MSTTPTNSGPAKAEQFMSSPLVAWLKTFDNQTMPMETVHDLSNGILMNKVMYTVDPNAYSMSKVNRSVTLDLALCLQNLQLLVQRIKHFYLTTVQQLVISNLPNISSICYDPESDYSLDQLEKLLILLLGCAIQCESKGPIIEKMKSMDLSQQQSLVVYIQQVTETTDFVCSIDWNDLEEISKQNLEGLCRTAYIHLQRVAKERDHHYDYMVEVLLERDYYKSLHDTQNPNVSLPRENGLPATLASPMRSPSINPEILELKKKCRTLQEKLDHKLETLSELREEMDKARSTITQLHHEKRALAEDAKSVRIYRDEVEALRVQSAKVEKLEADVVKYRQKAEDTDYLKKRISDLQGQNDLMVQTKKLLEQKATSLSAKTDTMDDLQEEMASLKVRVESFQEEKEMDNEKIEELLGLNTRLEMDVKHYEEKLAVLSNELESVKETTGNSSAGEASNLSFELTEADLASKAKVLRLEKETREMEKTVEALRHSQAKSAELEKTNKKLYTQAHSDRKDIIKLKEENEVLKVKASRVDKLQVELNSQREQLAEANRLAPKLKNIKGRNETLLEAKAKLEDEVENLQSKLSLLDDLRDENISLKVQLDSHNSEHNEDQQRIQELMELNAQLELEKQRETEEVESLRAQLLQLQSRTSSSPHVTVLSPPRVSEAEIASRAKLQRLEKETREMEKSMEALRHSQAKCAEFEKMNKKLQAQTHSDRKAIIKLKEELHGNRAKVSRMEQLQSEMKSQEHQLEDIDGASRKITELRQQNALLSETKVLLEEELTSLHNKLDRLGEFQVENAALKVRVESLESENKDEGLRMQELLQQNAQLEMTRDSKSVEIEALHSEVTKLKLKPSSEDTDSPAQPSSTDGDIATQTKLLRLERDNRELERSVQVLKQSSERVNAEIEKTNKKLTAQIHADKKEIARLKEELRRERSHHARLSRISSVGDDHDLHEAKQLQELESKFKDFYSQSLSNKDDRIKVLDSRIEEMTDENEQLKQEIRDLRKHMDKLKEMSNGGSPRASPGMGRTYTSREMNRLKEQAADSIRLRDKLHALQEDNNHLSGDLMEAKHVLHQHESHGQRLNDRIQMLEQLNHTLEEEKKTLLLQVNKLLEKNQDMLVRTLENKDQAFEEERMFTDRLGELERDKARLTEQLISHQREQISKEMDLWKKSKSKNILKKGFKKLKGKISGRSHTFEVPEGSALGGSSNTLSGGSMGSPSGSGNILGLPPLGYQLDGDMSQSSQSISSSNSGRHSEDQDIIEPEGGLGSGSLVPRAPTMDGSPFLRQKKTRSYTLPGIGAVKMRHGHSHAAASPVIEPERSSDNLISLEDFLAESEKTPNKRRVMELQRASLIISTPPSTPRNSLYIPVPPSSSSSNSTQMFDLQEFLSKFDPSESPGVIPEDEEVPQLSKAPSREFKSSQQSMSQRSRSSSSLQSAPSQTSLSSKNTEAVIVNPAINSNFNNNNSNNSDLGKRQSSVPHVFFSLNSTGGSTTLTESHNGPSSSTPNGEANSTISWKDTSTISSHSYDTGSYRTNIDPRYLAVNEGTTFVSLNDMERRSKSVSVVSGRMPRSHSSDALKEDVKNGKEKGRGLFRKRFHRSTGTLLEEPESKAKASSKSSKPPAGKRKKDKSEPSVSGKKKWSNRGGTKQTTSRNPEFQVINERRPSLSALTDLSQASDRTDYMVKNTREKTDKSYKTVSRLSLPVWGLSASSSSENVYDASQETDELASLSQPPSNFSQQGRLSIPEEDSIWLEYGRL